VPHRKGGVLAAMERLSADSAAQRMAA
jgi:hypothetical protein